MAHNGLAFVPTRFGARHGITWNLSLEAAAANLRHGSDDEVVAITASFIRDGRALNRHTRRRQAKLLNVSKQVSAFGESMACGKDAHVSLIGKVLAGGGVGDVLIEAAPRWFNDEINEHAADLERMRTTEPKIYTALMAGKLATAAKFARRDINGSRLQRILIRQANLLIIETAHSRVQLIRQLAEEPYGTQFSGFTRWKTAGHVLLTTVAAPASVSQRVFAAAQTFPTVMEEMHSFLVCQRLLPDNADGARVVSLAATALQELGNDASPKRMAASAERIFHSLRGVAALDSDNLRAMDLTRPSFVEWRTAFSPSEASTLVAIDMLASLRAVPTMVAALLGTNAPEQAPPASDRQITYSAALLRAAGKPDKESLALGRALGRDGGLHEANRSARQPLLAVKKKVDKHPDCAARFKEEFAINAQRFFES